MTHLTNLARRIRRERKERRWTLQRLADELRKAGCESNKSNLSRIENQRRSVSVNELIALAQVFDTTPAELLGNLHSAPREREHITQKPLEVMRELVQIVPEGAVILDPFMGSGTTGVAALLEGRRFVGIELVEHFSEVAERRIRTAAGQHVGSQDVLDFEGA